MYFRSKRSSDYSYRQNYQKRYPLAHHVGGGAERFVEQTFDGQPLDGTILVVPEAMVILREQVPGQGVVRDLNSQIVVNAENEREKKKKMGSQFRKEREREHAHWFERQNYFFFINFFKLVWRRDICCLSSIYYFIENVYKKLNIE